MIILFVRKSANTIEFEDEIIRSESKIQLRMFLHHLGKFKGSIFGHLICKLKVELVINSEEENFIDRVIGQVLSKHWDEIVNSAELIVKTVSGWSISF